MSRHNRERRETRKQLKALQQIKKAKKKRPDPGPSPTYRDDNPEPFRGEQSAKSIPLRFREDEPAGIAFVKRKADESPADGSGTRSAQPDQQATP